MDVPSVDSRPAPRELSAVWVRVGVPGVLAASLVAVGALVVGWIAPAADLSADPVLLQLRESLPVVFAAKAAVIVGVGWLLRTWLAAGRTAAGLDVHSARRLGAMVLVWSAPLLVAPVLFSRDVFSYVALSRLQPAGIDPYQHGTGALTTYLADGADPMWAESPAPYGPMWMFASSVLFHLTGAEATASVLGFRLLAFVGVALLVVFVPRLADLSGADPGRATWLAVLNPLVLFHLTSAAHNDALMMGLLVAGIATAMHRNFTVGVLLVVVAGAIKAPALLALPFLALLHVGPDADWWRRLAAWARVAALATGALAVLSVTTGFGLGWAANLTTPTRVDTWLSPVTAIGRTMGSLTEAVGLLDAATVLQAMRTLGTVCSALLVCWLLLTARTRPLLRGAALAVLGVVLLGPVVHPWYLLWAVPLLAGAGLTKDETRWAVGASIAVAVYSVANTSATTTSLVTLPDGIAALVSVVVLTGMLVGPLGTRQLLQRRRDPQPVVAPS
jgi:hypothetical protein